MLSFSALFITCGIILPIFFHSLGISGSIFLPMHIPVLLGGLILGWRAGLLIGFITPIISSFLTGMPPLFPILPMMTIELALYGAASGYTYQSLHWPLFVSLLFAMAIGRIGVAVMIAALADSLHIQLSPLIYIIMSLSQGALGVIIQLVFIPVFINRFNKIIYVKGVYKNNEKK
ncbi:ECF transporter S component [Megasphaera paucivorans]|nr:ECF transporter S component [Megasphaera paucivorans]